MAYLGRISVSWEACYLGNCMISESIRWITAEVQCMYTGADVHLAWHRC